MALQCVVDLLGNLCNADDPQRLPLVRSRVPPLVADSRRGPAVDLDALLLTLLEDIVTGTQRIRCLLCTTLSLCRRASCVLVVVRLMLTRCALSCAC